MRRAFWLAVVVGAGAVSVGGGQQPQPAAPAAPWANKFFVENIATNRDQPAPPVISWDFKDVPHGTLCTHTFSVTNIYDVPVQITEVRKSCTCLDFVPMAKALQPNETGEFTVIMNSGKFVGQNSQTFYVTFGPRYVSTAVIKVSATSKTDVTVSPGAVIFGTVSSGAKASQSVKLEYKGGQKNPPWKITEAVSPSPMLDVQVTETGRGGFLKGGVDYQVTVALKPGIPAGAIAEQITLKTNDPHNPLIHVTVTGAVAAPLEVIPGRVRIDGVAVGQSASQRVILRAAKSFRVVGVDGTGDGITVELPPGGAALPVQILTVKFDPTKPGPVGRELRVRTDLDGGAGVPLPVEAEAAK